VNATKKTRILK